MKLTDEDFNRIVQFIRQNYGINLSQKRLLIEGRLQYTVKEKGFTCYKDYIDFVLKDTTGAEITLFMNKLTTNHTFFMREKDHFDFLNNTLLPLFEKVNKDREIRIWSAGCSFGNEPYNLLMYIEDYFGEQKRGWDYKILATDISQKALTFARKGEYKKADLNDIPAHWLEKYFVKVDDQTYKITKEIREQVVFKYFNLMDDISFKKPFDLILCRNVMIYFEADTREALVNRFFNATKDGGYLYIGHAENISKNNKYIMVKPAIYVKKTDK